jgi:general secretion pathway protein M
MPIKARLSAARAQGRQRWQALAPRERRAIALAGGLLGALFGWQLLIAPALAQIAHWEVETPKLRSQAQALDALLGQHPAAAVGSLEQVLRDSLAQAGLQDLSRLDGSGGSWQLGWQHAPAEAAVAWMQQVPSRLGLSIGQLTLRRDADGPPGSPVTFSGTLRMDQAPGAKDPS